MVVVRILLPKPAPSSSPDSIASASALFVCIKHAAEDIARALVLILALVTKQFA